MQGQKSLPRGEKSTGEEVVQAQDRHVHCLTTPNVMVLRVGDACLVGVGKCAPHGLRCLCLVPPHGSLDGLESSFVISLYKILKDRHAKAAG